MLSFVTQMFTSHLGALELAGASIASVGIQGSAYVFQVRPVFVTPASLLRKRELYICVEDDFRAVGLFKLRPCVVFRGYSECEVVSLSRPERERVLLGLYLVQFGWFSSLSCLFSGHLGALELAGASIASVGIQGLAYGIMV
ncbi:Protein DETOXIFICATION 41 [Camellia lanceoleosa]|uniref:Protein DETOXIFICATION 41 n=1 Tax=Camellia lanceoleosa TaxID=1840588 RepID=A0ACC0G2G6_9ERIC|nr:Protein DETOXIFICATION 41 [Camellia lanceoleosa]